jgi:hypothetical protein
MNDLAGGQNWPAFFLFLAVLREAQIPHLPDYQMAARLNPSITDYLPD